MDTKEDGVPWTDDEFRLGNEKGGYPVLRDTDKNCSASRNANLYFLYVKKGTRCTIDATFMENDDYRAKTETITIYADK